MYSMCIVQPTGQVAGILPPPLDIHLLTAVSGVRIIGGRFVKECVVLSV